MDLQTLVEKREFIKNFIDEFNKHCEFNYEEILMPTDEHIEEIISIIMKTKLQIDGKTSTAHEVIELLDRSIEEDAAIEEFWNDYNSKATFQIKGNIKEFLEQAARNLFNASFQAGTLAKCCDNYAFSRQKIEKEVEEELKQAEEKRSRRL